MAQQPVTASTSKPTQKLQHIDQLRGVAILLVIITHVALNATHINGQLQQILLLGRIGVQLFFFLSAYTLCLSMSARHDENHLSNFYIRRFFRIAPLYYVGIFLYFLLDANGLLKPHFSDLPGADYTLTNILCNIFFIHGFVDSANNTIVPGGWSIGTEMVFYVVFPAIFALYTRVKKPVYFILPLLALVLAHVYVAACYLIYHQEVFTNHFFYASIFNEIPVFIIGISFFFLDRLRAVKFSNIVSAISFSGLFLLAMYLLFTLKNNISLPIFIAGISFIFLFTLFRQAQFQIPLLTRIGQLSYSIYIFHFVFAYTVASQISKALGLRVNINLVFLINLVQAVFLSMLVAIISEKLVEKPGINLGKALIKRLNNRP
jgi:peptidoglycan/LPS O-acetylase OafA/YrhL